MIRATVWHTGRKRLTWHYAIHDHAGRVILYDNTGDYETILRSALIRVEALRHMEIAGHRLEEYKGYIGDHFLHH